MAATENAGNGGPATAETTTETTAEAKPAAKPEADEFKWPESFTKLQTVLDGSANYGLHSVAGIVKGCIAPITLQTGQFKMMLELFDESMENYNDVKIHIFKDHEEEMPKVDAGDVVVARNFKLQKYNNMMSLLSNYASRIYVYPANKIPPLPANAGVALNRQLTDAQKTPPPPSDYKLVSWLFYNVDKSAVPEMVVFQDMVERSTKVQDKFRLLKDVSDNMFCNLIVRVEHPPYVANSMVSMWVSDYSENSQFQDFGSESGGTAAGGEVGDPMAYMSKYTTRAAKNRMLADWKGPRGRLSIQMTCFDPHASYIQKHVKVHDWLELKNVQIRTGHNGLYLEGFMRDDTARNSPLRVLLIDTENLEFMDPRYKDALRRMRDYLKAAKSFPALPGLKRKSAKPEGEGEKSDKSGKKKSKASKVNRKQKRAKLSEAYEQQKAATKETDTPLTAHLNNNVVSEHADQAPTPLAAVLAPVLFDMPGDRGPGQVALPFINVKFRAQVRVVGFLPARLEDFAAARMRSELDVLSDNESEDMDDDDEDEGVIIGSSTAIWEWRFALLLEDATPGDTTRARVWAVVDNSEAQLLTGLDACDLRIAPTVLDALREVLFVLWGDLEEKQRLRLRREREAKAAQRQGKKREAEKKRRAPALAPPDDSSDDEWRKTDRSDKPDKPDKPEPPQDDLQTSNRPFVCCLRQYGVRAQAADGRTAWQQTFGLFGTKINAVASQEEEDG